MDILDMSDEITVISDLMFPKTMLPDRLFPLIQPVGCLQALEFIPAFPAEIAFDQPPSQREIVVIFRQRPDAVKMVWQ
jgi:hypothetical protein